VEHVIPESQGNTEHVLRPGVVCDKCNNHFSNHVEGSLLADPYFADQRFRTTVLVLALILDDLLWIDSRAAATS
jgi:HNH endonuclease